jgi:hypothetical protein
VKSELTDEFIARFEKHAEYDGWFAGCNEQGHC